MKTTGLNRASRASERFFVFCLLTLLSAPIPACVTETKRPKPGLTRSTDVITQPPTPANPTTAQPRPTTPIARPAQSARTRDTRVRVAVAPIGRIPYDGLTLPLVSPDGRFIAAQTGPAPAWDALLAQPGGFVPAATRLAVWNIAEAKALQPVSGPERLPPGLLLGRSANESGYLVEAPRPDGSRRIGLVEWVSGTLTWLTDETACTAFATLGPEGQLAYSQQDPRTGRWSLVVRPQALSPDGELVAEARADESLVFPLAGLDRAHVYALSVPTGPDASLSIVAVSLGGPGAKAPAGQIVARERLGVEATIAAAFQAVAPMQTPWPGDPRNLGLLGEGVAVVSARARAAVWFSPTTGLVPLARDSASAVPLVSPAAVGLLCATGRELIFQAERLESGVPGWEQGASVIASGSIARATLANGAQSVLFDPAGSATPPTLGVLVLQPVAGQ